MLQRNAFGQKFFLILCMGLKVPFWKKLKIPLLSFWFHKVKKHFLEMNGFYLGKYYELLGKDYEAALVGTRNFS